MPVNTVQINKIQPTVPITQDMAQIQVTMIESLIVQGAYEQGKLCNELPLFSK